MPIFQRNTIEGDVAELRSFLNSFKIRRQIFQKTIEAKELADAAAAAQNLFKLIQKTADNMQVTPLVSLLEESTKITHDIHAIAMNETHKFPPPNWYMRKIVENFEAFSRRIASPHVRRRLRSAASFVPIIAGLAEAIGGIPHYFEFASRLEKATMLLAAVLLVTALAMTLAIFFSPAFGTVPFLAKGITICVLLSRVLYEQSAKNAKKQYAAKPIVIRAGADFQQLKQDMLAYRKSKFELRRIDEAKQEKIMRRSTRDIKTWREAERDLRKFTDDTFATYGPGQSREIHRTPIEPKPIPRMRYKPRARAR